MVGPRRRYTELCNRSASPSSPPLLLPSRPNPLLTESLEDYWEDASVSIRPCRSWDPSPSAWLGAAAAAAALCPLLDSENSDRNASSHGARARPCRYSFDANDHCSLARSRRCFPPPLASCSTLSIKEGGRFVLKEMDADRPHGFFRAQRENGRLLLELVLPEESTDEVAALESDNNVDGVVDEDEDSASVIECLEGSVACAPDQAFSGIDAAQDLIKVLRRDHSDCVPGEEIVSDRNSDDISAEKSKEREWPSGTRPCEGGVLNDSSFSTSELEDGALSKTAGIEACLGRLDVCKEDGIRRGGGYDGNIDESLLVGKGKLCEEKEDDVGLTMQECLWHGDAANCSMPSWSTGQMYLHGRPPLIKRPSVCGLAM